MYRKDRLHGIKVSKQMMAAFVLHGLNNLQAKPLLLLLLGVIAPMQRNHYEGGGCLMAEIVEKVVVLVEE